MTDTTAKIRAKSTDGTGITENHATNLYNQLGTHLMAIVDLQVVDKRGPNLQGKRTVELVIDGIEPALDNDLAEHLRELQRAIYLNRQHHTEQTLIDDTITPKVTDVLTAGTRYTPHPYTSGSLSEQDDHAICDICGLLQNTPVHETLTDPDLD